MSANDRDVLFQNESFVIGMLQVVSAAGIVAAIAQGNAIVNLIGSTPFLLYLTAFSLALIAALLAAYWKHQYKMWDIKSQASNTGGDLKEAQVRNSRARRYLGWMRRAFVISLVLIVGAIATFLVGAWIRAYPSA